MVPVRVRQRYALVFRRTNPLNRILPDGTEEWHDGRGEICLIYRTEYEYREMTTTFTTAAWLRYVDSGEDNLEFPSLEAQYKCKIRCRVWLNRLKSK